MIKITKKEVEIIKKIGVAIEPEVTTLYSVCAFNKKVEKIKDIVFKEVVTETNGTYLNFIKDYDDYKDDYKVFIDPETLEISEDSDVFLDYEMAVKIHRERREEYLKYLKYAIASAKNEKAEAEEELERCEKLLKEFYKGERK